MVFVSVDVRVCWREKENANDTDNSEHIEYRVRANKRMSEERKNADDKTKNNECVYLFIYILNNIIKRLDNIYLCACV